MASEHIVQFFDDDRSLSRGVATFLAEGAAAGKNLLVVARQSRWLRISERLQAAGVGLDALQRGGRLTVLDAGATLDSITRQGEPVEELFDIAFGAVVERLAERPLLVYGEMVDLLAEEGNFDAARQLEEMWNGLARRHSFVLLCGYSAVHFGSATTGDALRGICRAHTRTVSRPADELATWLLTANGIHTLV